MIAQVRNIAAAAAAVLGAIIAAATLSAIAGPEFSIAAVGALIAIVGMMGIQQGQKWVTRVEKSLAKVDYHLAINGEEYRLPEELKTKPLRSLVIHCVNYITEFEEARVVRDEEREAKR